MKINAGVHQLNHNTKIQDQGKSASTPRASFSQLVAQSTQKNNFVEIERMLKDVELKATLLKRSMTIQGLREYKRSVQQLLILVVREGLGSKDVLGFNRRGGRKRYTLLDEIDRKLLEITDDLLLSEQARLELLRRIGDIKGLLIHLLY